MAIVTNLTQVHRDVTERLRLLYGDRLERIILYGSYARGDFHEESDVDYLAVLSDEHVSAFREVNQIAPVTAAYFLETFIPVSVFATSSRQLTADRPFFSEVRKDGITIYERIPQPVHS